MNENRKICLVAVAVLAVSGCSAQPGVPPAAATLTPTATPMPTLVYEPTRTPAPIQEPTAVPTDTPVPTPRPLGEGECIGWYESPSFLDQAVCVEGKVNFVRNANPARTLFFLVIDPSVQNMVQCCGLFYGWLYVEDLFDPIPADGISALLEGKCVRLHGTIEKTLGQGGMAYRISVQTPEQLEIIECGECQVPDACGF